MYLNKQNLFTPFLLDMHYMVPLAYMAYLIAKNPCTLSNILVYLTFPAALPLLMIAEGVRTFINYHSLIEMVCQKETL